MSKHTPGPWAVDPNDSFLVTADCDGLMVCFTETDDRQADDEAEANARLIAAAPELLATLQDNLGYIPCTCEYPRIELGHADTCARRRVSAAIAKATGGAA